ncbi:MAG: hypothetical protein M3024_15840 [Candidatus Dormibacteraeota bacterium]|nr:hypothetical protein [Candidatus Dormibacteraeota bacterium]
MNLTIVPMARMPLVWMLTALLITFLVTRWTTRRIRAGATGLRNWSIGGVHVHHQVFGILTILVAGCLEFAYRPASPWNDLLSAMFGVGVGLTLDEFALWLYMDDVYWTSAGRKSIDAVFVATVVTCLLLVGVTPLTVSGGDPELRWLLAVTIVVNLFLCIITFLKGKPILGIIGLLVWLVALVASMRLAKPGSQWATWRYSESSSKRSRSEQRFGAAYQARWDRVRDLVGGAPTPPV